MRSKKREREILGMTAAATKTPEGGSAALLSAAGAQTKINGASGVFTTRWRSLPPLILPADPLLPSIRGRTARSSLPSLGFHPPPPLLIRFPSRRTRAQVRAHTAGALLELCEDPLFCRQPLRFHFVFFLLFSSSTSVSCVPPAFLLWSSFFVFLTSPFVWLRPLAV